jgi:hypothetical protein
MYDPTVGRWLSQDPIGFKAGDPNLYRYVGNSPTNATDPSGLQEAEGPISRAGEDWQLIYIFAFSGESPEYIVRKVEAAGQAAKSGMSPSGPGINLHPIEHCLNEHMGGKTPYLSGSKLPNGAPNIAGEPVWVDLNKVRADVTTYDDIIKMSKEFLERNPHLKERFDLWKRAGEAEVLIKGEVPANAVSTKNGIRLRTGLSYGGKALFLYAVYADTNSFIVAEDKAGEAARIAGGWTGAWAGGCVGASGGARAGAGIALALGFAGPQAAAPEEVVTVPVGAGIGGIVGGFAGGIGGYWIGSQAGRNYYDFIQKYQKR